MLHARRIELEPSFAAKKAVGVQDREKRGVSRENGLFVDYVANNGKQIPGHRLQEKALVQKSCFHVASLR